MTLSYFRLPHACQIHDCSICKSNFVLTTFYFRKYFDSYTIYVSIVKNLSVRNTLTHDFRASLVVLANYKNMYMYEQVISEIEILKHPANRRCDVAKTSCPTFMLKGQTLFFVSFLLYNIDHLYRSNIDNINIDQIKNIYITNKHNSFSMHGKQSLS